MGHPWTVGTVVVWGLLFAPVASHGGTCQVELPTHVRIADCPIASALADGLARSASLQRIVERVGALKGIVTVSVIALDKRAGVAGGLSHEIGSTDETRFLHVRLIREYAYGVRIVTTLAHEFRHALEVLEDPAVRTKADVDALFARIGYQRGKGVVETDAALEMGKIVEKELKQNKKSRRAADSTRPITASQARPG